MVPGVAPGVDPGVDVGLLKLNLDNLLQKVISLNHYLTPSVQKVNDYSLFSTILQSKNMKR